MFFKNLIINTKNKIFINILCIIQAVIDGLSNRGHVVNELDVAGSVVSAISRENGRVYANSDVRKAGGVDGFQIIQTLGTTNIFAYKVQFIYETSNWSQKRL